MLTQNETKRGSWMAAAVVSVVCILVAVYALYAYWQVQGVREYGPDEGTYSYVGWAWGAGRWPYQDSWDHKGPAVYVVTLVRSYLVGDPGPWALGLQEIVLGGMAAVLLGWIAHLLWGGTGFGLGLLFGVLLWTRGGPAAGHMSTPGSLIALLTVTSIVFALLAARGKALWVVAVGAVAVGIAGGLAFSAKPNAMSGLVLGFLILCTAPRLGTWRTRIAMGGFTLLGFSVPVSGFALLFALNGCLDDMIDACLHFNRIRGQLILTGNPPDAILKSTLRCLSNIDILAPIVAVVVMTTAAIWNSIRKRNAYRTIEPAVIILSWLVLELGILLSNGAFGHHAYTVLPPVALGCAWIIAVPWIHGSPGALAQSIAIFSLLVVPALYEMRTAEPRSAPSDPELEELIATIRRDTGDGATVIAPFSFGGSVMLCRTGRFSAVRYTYPIPLYTIGYANDDRWKELVDAMESKSPPAAIVIPPPGLTTITNSRIPPAMADPRIYPHQTRFIELLRTQYRRREIGAYLLFQPVDSREATASNGEVSQ